ncbi:MAG: MerR family transcriptional regulator [Actinomycetota bacterium]|nr:MerR family transcriptional regulator [Actinomycetota bacterium]
MDDPSVEPTETSDPADGGPAGAEPVADEPAADEHEDELLTLEQLSELSGVPARTIRYYQAEKLLDRPDRDRKDARMARYGTRHVERLRLVGELRDRGLKLPAIRTLVQEGDASARVADWLGLDEQLRGSWGPDVPRLVSRDELAQLTAATPPGTQGLLEDSGLLVRQGDAWLLPAPSLLELCVQLIADGVEIDLVLDAGKILQRHLGKAADELVDLFVGATRAGFGRGSEPDVLVNALRPSAGDAARIIFAQQLERAIAALLADTKRLRPRGGSGKR